MESLGTVLFDLFLIFYLQLFWLMLYSFSSEFFPNQGNQVENYLFGESPFIYLYRGRSNYASCGESYE